MMISAVTSNAPPTNIGMISSSAIKYPPRLRFLSVGARVVFDSFDPNECGMQRKERKT